MTSHYLNQCRPDSLTYICSTRGRWVKVPDSGLQVTCNSANRGSNTSAATGHLRCRSEQAASGRWLQFTKQWVGTMGRCSYQKWLCMWAVANKIMWLAVSRDHGDWGVNVQSHEYRHVNTRFKTGTLLYFTKTFPFHTGTFQHTMAYSDALWWHNMGQHWLRICLDGTKLLPEPMLTFH